MGNKNVIYGVVAVVALGAAAFFFLRGDSSASAPSPSRGAVVSSGDDLAPPKADLPAERTSGKSSGSSGSARLTSTPGQAEDAVEPESAPQEQQPKKSGSRDKRKTTKKSNSKPQEEEFEQPQEKKKEKARRF